MKIIADINPDFLERNLNLPEKIIFQSPAISGGKKFLSVVRRGDSEENHYFYSQRNGKDSIRFILYDKTRPKPFGLLEHLESSQNKVLRSAYSGSNDKDKPLIEICKEEVTEESQFDLEDTNRITLVRPMGLGSQTNEIAHLYLVDVEGLSEAPMHPENEWEENVNHPWLSLEEVKEQGDWASYVIADSTRVLGIDKKQNNIIIAKENSSMGSNRIIAKYENDGEDYFPEIHNEHDINDYIDYLYNTDDLLCVKHKKYILQNLPRKPFMLHNLNDYKIDGGKAGLDFIITEKKGLKRRYNIEFSKDFINIWEQTKPRQRLTDFRHKLELIIKDLF